jgi:hypothetical protein
MLIIRISIYKAWLTAALPGVFYVKRESNARARGGYWKGRLSKLGVARQACAVRCIPEANQADETQYCKTEEREAIQLSAPT